MSTSDPLAMPATISRHDAWRAGKPRFFTGRPCRKGHISERYTSSGACIACGTFSRKPITGPNVGSLPGPIAFPPDVYVSPGLLQYAHELVFAAAPRISDEYRRLCGGLTWDEVCTTEKAAGVTLEAFKAKGWTPAKLVDHGYARPIRSLVDSKRYFMHPPTRAAVGEVLGLPPEEQKPPAPILDAVPRTPEREDPARDEDGRPLHRPSWP